MRIQEETLSFEDLLNETYARDEVQNGEVVCATVMSIGKDYVSVDIGYKSDGLIPISEFPLVGGKIQVVVGEKINVMIESRENASGHLILSKEKADRIKRWDQILLAFEREEIITGVVTGRTKGGLQVDIGVRAFLPGSQIDLRPVKNLDKMVGEKLQFKILKCSKKRGNIVLSRRVILERDRDKKRALMLQLITEGVILDGVIKNVTDYGAFVDLGGLDGLLHVTDMSWGRIQNPQQHFQIGHVVKVKVLKYDQQNGRVSLGIKQMHEDPWIQISDEFISGARVSGLVVSLTDYGAFVQLSPGIEGLIHVSEMSWIKRVKHPSKIMAVGDHVSAIILDINKETRRISLGIKQTLLNPWNSLEDKYPIGTVIRGEVRNITDFGVFINVEEGIDGLVHISDLSWTHRVRHPSEILKKGDVIEVVVLNIDAPNERFSLGIKQLNEDPWGRIPQVYPRGARVKGTVSKVTDFGAFIEIEPGIDGLCHVSEFSDEHVKNPREFIKPGDIVEVVIIDIDSQDRKISLSIRATQSTETTLSYRSYLSQYKDGSKGGMGILGDALKDYSISKM